jgi:hypothetical protein
MSVLKIGSVGPEVVKVKAQLAKQGAWSAHNTSPNYTPSLAKAVAYFQQTHLNERGEPCGVDGRVGLETRWALAHPTGKAQRNFITVGSEGLPGGLSEGRSSLLAIAIAQHGIKEVPNGSNRSSSPRGGVDKFLPHWCRKDDEKGPPWCCFFVSWVHNEALGVYPLGERVGSCARAWKLAQGGMRFRNSGRRSPGPGDAFVMLYKSDGSFTGKGHIGFVLRVSEGNSKINTIDGNCGNRVKVGVRDLTDDRVVGFIDPWKDGRTLQNFDRGLIAASNVGELGTR